jgi:Domain of unknown function (DUF4124)
MDKRPIFLLAGLLAAGSLLAEAYRWVDSDGVVHYSDRPEPGAEKIVLPEANTTSVRRVTPRPSSTAAASAGAEQPAPVKYESLSITTPAAEETLWNIEGVLNVSLALTPALQPGHQVRVYFDGKPQMVDGTSFQLQEVWRGVHNIQAEVLDATGKLMIRSQPNRFYVQQNTVNF